jgi:hypothetical protein
MKTYIADIIPKIQKYSKRLDDLTKLTNQEWVLIGDNNQNKHLYIFKSNNELIISINGIVEKGKWEFIINQSIIIETNNGNYLYKHSFFDGNILALKLDSTESFSFFVNQTKYEKELNSIDDILNFLNIKYLKHENYIGNNTRFSEEEQNKWIDDPDKCPGCGFSGVLNKKICPDCELNLS